MTFIMTTTGAVMLKAGAHADYETDNGLTSAARMLTAVSGAEAYVIDNVRIDLPTAYPTLSPTKKHMISDTISSHAAIPLINYDTDGWSANAALTAINVNWAIVQDNIRKLNEKKTTDFIQT